MDAAQLVDDHRSMEQARVQLEKVQTTYNEIFKKRTAEINELRDCMRARARKDHEALVQISANLFKEYEALVGPPDAEQSK
jgi:uncharacterized protein with von Willebrand factor type A (vWA) domain